MAERDGATVGIDVLGIVAEAKLTEDGKRLGREGLD